MSIVKLEQVRALLDAKLRREDDRFWAVATQIVAKLNLARSSQARTFELLVERGRSMTTPTSPQQAQLLELPRHGGTPILFETPTQERSELLLSERAQAQIDDFVTEQEHADRLREAGFEPARRLLLVGAPGTGKTMTARVIAKMLGLPLGYLQLHSVIDSYMGETAKQMARVFGQIAQTKAVYFFDEIDAISAQRQATKNSVDAEARRTVNSLLMLLDADRSDSIIIGATNLPDHLDHALMRRFDHVVSYEHPTSDHAQLLLQRRLARVHHESPFNWEYVGALAARLSHSDIETVANAVGRRAVITGEPITTTILSAAIKQRGRDSKRHG